MKIEDMDKLKLPFPKEDIDWRLQSCGEKNGKFWGKALAYITSRAVQDRLDEVCGTDGWQTTISKVGDAYLCTLSIRVTHSDGSTEWISRTDGADATDIEAVKGGISGAIKRAAVLFGIGRYLYNITESWAIITENGKYNGCTKDKKYFKWDPPELPAWALPKNFTEEQLIEQTTILENYLANNVFDGVPNADKLRANAQDAINKKDYERICKANAYIQSIKGVV